MLGRDIPPAPLKRGDLGCCFLVGNEWFVVCRIPLLRGDQGVCYGERRGMGGDDFAAVWRCGVSWLRVVALGLRWLCLGVTHPLPLSRGEVRTLFSCW